MVREFAREDERRVMLVLDPFIGPPRDRNLGANWLQPSTPSASSAPFPWPPASPGTSTKLIPSCNFARDRFARPWRPPAKSSTTRCANWPLIQPDASALGGAIPRRPRRRTRNFQNHSHRPAATHHSHRAVVLLVFSHFDQLRVCNGACSRRLALRISLKCASRLPPLPPYATIPPHEIAIHSAHAKKLSKRRTARLVRASTAATFPGARSRDPYRIWVAEIMLQQTRIAAVIPITSVS